jgi:rRNA maturation endonuclease Nob1
MGIFDDVISKVKSDAKYEVSSGISSGVRAGFKKGVGIFSKDKSIKPLDKCPKCKTKISDPNLKFCSECGAKLSVNCSKCSIDFPIGTKFCNQCGGPLK